MNPEHIFDEFPAPSYRGNQEDALTEIKQAFESGNDIVLVQAPTGSGKSLLARAIAGCARESNSSKGGGKPIGAYYTTPQVSQLEDVADDPLLEDMDIILGKNNYSCILDGDEGVPVTEAKCSRDPNFECPEIGDCPYYSRRRSASTASIAGMTLAYFMETAHLDFFDKRDIIVIDEAHGLPNWAEIYAAIEIGPKTIPNWHEVKPCEFPQCDITEVSTVADAHAYIEELSPIAKTWLRELQNREGIEPEKARIREHLRQLVPDLEWFLDTVEGDNSLQWVLAKQKGDGFTLKPLHPERFLKHALWQRGEKFAMLSATLLDADSFCYEVGLDPDDAELIQIDHSFPVRNRPLYDVTKFTGEMKQDHRQTTIPKIAEVIVRLLSKHPGESGIIHCHSYGIQKQLASTVRELSNSSRIRVHDKHDRDDQLEQWMESTAPEVFFSVSMEEALDLKGDLCRWQVLCKAPYPNVGDPVVEHHLNEDRWGWYYRKTLRTIIQACGRVVRSGDDFGATYIADKNILDVFSRAAGSIPPWFQDQIDQMTVPALPEQKPGKPY